MSKSSKVALALIAGVVVGVAVAYIVKEKNTENDIAENKEPTVLDNITQQFSDKISTELKAAEKKIRSAVKKEIGIASPEKELGLFL